MRHVPSVRWLLVVCACAAAGGLAPGEAPAAGNGPSFDCAKASEPDEKAICADPKLAAIDRLIADAYKNFQPEFAGDKRKIARALIADRHACGSDKACIVSAMNNALQTYGDVPDWVWSYNEALIGRKALDAAAGAPGDAEQPLPARIGGCGLTHITGLGPRLGDEPLQSAPPEAGSAVSFANGGGGVSYDREPGLVSSKVGDPVAVCLVSIPRDCPPGDDRGRMYYGVDLARHGSWMLPDSQHMCGGA
jgi:uncharacterized protein